MSTMHAFLKMPSVHAYALCPKKLYKLSLPVCVHRSAAMKLTTQQRALFSLPDLSQ